MSFKFYLCSKIGPILSKFIEKIEYPEDNEGKVCLVFRDNLFQNDQLIIKKMEIGSLTRVFGIDIVSYLINSSYYFPTQSNQKPSIIKSLLKLTLILIFTVFKIFFSLLFAAINLMFHKYIVYLKFFIFRIIDKLHNGFQIYFDFLSIDIEVPIINFQEKISLKLILKSGNISLTSIFNFDFVINFESIQFDLTNTTKNKTIININVPEINIMKENIKKLIVKTQSHLTIYFSIFDINTLLNLANQFKSVKNENSSDSKNDIDDKKIDLDLDLNLDISDIDFYIIKSNSPLLLVTITPQKVQYSMSQKNSEQKIEIKFELKHLCHNSYKVINRFSTILTINNYNIDVIVSPIHISLSSFLFKELFSPEYNDSYHSQLEHQYKNIFFQNDTKLEIDLFLINKEKKKCYIQLNDDKPVKIKEEDYEPDIIMKFKDKEHSFTIKSLYSPILLDKDIIVSLKLENGINIVHFTSPYVFQNWLSYDIDIVLCKNYFLKVKSAKDKYIPCDINFDLSKLIWVSKHDQFHIDELEFNSSEPVKLMDDNFQIDSNPANFYSTYFLSFDTTKTICSINFFPYITISNFLPYDIKLRIENIKDIELKKGLYYDLSYLKDIDENFVFFFKFGDNADGGTVYVKSKIESFKKEVNVYKNGEIIGQIVFECSEVKIDKKKIYKMRIYCPLILQNCSSIPLSLQVSKNSSYQLTKNYIFYSSKSLMNHECSIKLPIVYDKLTKINSTNFQYVSNFSQVVPLQHKAKDKINLLLLLEKQKNNFEDFLNIPSSIISIRPYLKVHSDINETIILSPQSMDKNVQEFKNKCYKGDNIIFGSNKEGIFEIYVEGYQRCKYFNIFNLGSSVIRLSKASQINSYLLFKIVVKKEENGYCCYISYPTLTSDVSIHNKIKNKSICVRQKYQPKSNFVYNPMIIPPNNKLIYAKEQPFLFEESLCKYNCVISFGIDSTGFLLSYEEPCHSRRIKNTNIYYDVEKIDRDNRTIVIYESSKQVDENQNNKKGFQQLKVNFSLLLTEIQLSFIDNEMHELFLLTISKISLNLDHKIKLSIEGLSLNDMYAYSLSPVVLNGRKTPFLCVEIISKYPLKMLMFEDISIKIAPIQIFVDFLFIGDLIAAMKEVASFCKFELKNDFFSNIFSTKKFTIHNIIVSLTPVSLLNRQYRFKHEDHFYLSLFKIPFSKVIAIDFKDINLYNIESSIIDFFKSLPFCYLNQITLMKGIAFLAKFVFLIPKESKLFSDFIKNKNQICHDLILEFPRRIPRVFPNGIILDIPNCLTANYPDTPTLLQFMLQSFYGVKYSNQQLKEIFFDKEKNVWLAIFDSLLFFYKKDNAIKVDFIEIKSIEQYSSLLIIKYTEDTIYFTCENKEDAISVANKVGFYLQKIKISKEYP